MTFLEYAANSTSKSIVLIEMTIDGEVKGYTRKDFTPIGSAILYEGRLVSLFSIGRSRDPLTWGKLNYSSGSITLNNADGHFDSVARNDWFIGYYGSKVSIKFGYEELNVSNYITLWTGYISKMTLSPDQISIDVSESKKKLDEIDIQYSWVNINAMTVIQEAIILAYPSVTYDSTYFDTTTWSTISSLNILVSVDMAETKKALAVIEDVCSSIFGVFYMTAEDKYTMKLINPAATAVTTIVNSNILNVPDIDFDPSDVISSVRVYCDIDENLNTGRFSSIVEDITRVDYVSSTYGFLNSKEFITYLPGTTAAAAFAITFLDYSCDVHGTFSITTTMNYYTLEVGDTVNVELKRVNNVDYLNIIKCEILGKMYMLDAGKLKFDMRICYDET